MGTGDLHALEAKLDAVGYGFFIPVFFVTSGLSLDVKSILESPARLVVFFVLFLVVRGLPALLFYRRDLPMRERVQMVLLTATALPLLVALAEIGLKSGTMLPRTPPHWSARECSRSSSSPPRRSAWAERPLAPSNRPRQQPIPGLPIPPELPREYLRRLWPSRA